MIATRVQRPNICRSGNVRQTTLDIFQWEQIRFSIYNDSIVLQRRHLQNQEAIPGTTEEHLRLANKAQKTVLKLAVQFTYVLDCASSVRA